MSGLQYFMLVNAPFKSLCGFLAVPHQRHASPFNTGSLHRSGKAQNTPSRHIRLTLTHALKRSFRFTDRAAYPDVIPACGTKLQRIHFSTSCSLDKVKRHSTTTVLCLSKIVLTIETKCSMKSGGLSSAIIQPLLDAARRMICSAEDSITFWYS